ncbi:MAG: hypothetical protein OEY10_05255 [Nitrosopumilus sp.]|nr:hypothetical protein [Candidatus Bathyarchaeota archaeon]MDH5665685.1 hypothetical protein [Nitrosopumilus sp.]
MTEKLENDTMEELRRRIHAEVGVLERPEDLPLTKLEEGILTGMVDLSEMSITTLKTKTKISLKISAHTNKLGYLASRFGHEGKALLSYKPPRRVRVHGKKYKRTKATYFWSWNEKMMQTYLPKIIPHLTLQREQAELILKALVQKENTEEIKKLSKKLEQLNRGTEEEPDLDQYFRNLNHNTFL